MPTVLRGQGYSVAQDTGPPTPVDRPTNHQNIQDAMAATAPDPVKQAAQTTDAANANPKGIPFKFHPL